MPLASGDLPARLEEDALRFDARVGANQFDTLSKPQLDAIEQARGSVQKLFGLDPTALADAERKAEVAQAAAAKGGEIDADVVALTELLLSSEAGLEDAELGAMVGQMAQAALTEHSTPQVAPRLDERTEDFGLYAHAVQGLAALAAAAAVRDAYVKEDRAVLSHQRAKLGLGPALDPKASYAGAAILDAGVPKLADALLASNANQISKLDRMLATSDDPTWAAMLQPARAAIVASSEKVQALDTARASDPMATVELLNQLVWSAAQRREIGGLLEHVPADVKAGVDGVNVAQRFALLATEAEGAELATEAVGGAQALFEAGDSAGAKEALADLRGKLDQLSPMHQTAYSELIHRMDKTIELL